MSKAELRDVVTKPAKMARLSIEPGLVDLILHDVAPPRRTRPTPPGVYRYCPTCWPALGGSAVMAS
jgi:hypothetical protein